MDYKLELQNNNIDLNTILESINALPNVSGSNGIDTSDATATADDLAAGKTAYVNGEKITGTILHNVLITDGTLSTTAKYLQMTSHADIGKYIIGGGKTVTLEAYLDKLGDASPEDVAAGKTFTSTSGLKVTGTVPVINSGEYCETYYNSEEGFNGAWGEGHLGIVGIVDNNTILKQNSSVVVKVPMSYFGDASPEDVVAGKTFTTYHGTAVGTHVCSSGSSGSDTSDATATAEDIISGKTAYINGGKVTGSLVVNAYYVGNEEPPSSLGIDGDLFLVRGE